MNPLFSQFPEASQPERPEPDDASVQSTQSVQLPVSWRFPQLPDLRDLPAVPDRATRDDRETKSKAETSSPHGYHPYIAGLTGNPGGIPYTDHAASFPNRPMASAGSTSLNSRLASYPQAFQRRWEQERSLHMTLRSLLGHNTLAPWRPMLGQRNALLDVGCGTGAWAMEVAAQVNPRGVEVLGVDPDGSVVLPSRELMNPAAAGCYLTQGSGMTLKVNDNTFSLVHFRYMANAFTQAEWPWVLAEALRVTRPGGWLEIIEILPAQVSRSHNDIRGAGGQLQSDGFLNILQWHMAWWAGTDRSPYYHAMLREWLTRGGWDPRTIHERTQEFPISLRRTGAPLAAANMLLQRWLMHSLDDTGPELSAAHIVELSTFRDALARAQQDLAQHYVTVPVYIICAQKRDPFASSYPTSVPLPPPW